MNGYALESSDRDRIDQLRSVSEVVDLCHAGISDKIRVKDAFALFAMGNLRDYLKLWKAPL